MKTKTTGICILFAVGYILILTVSCNNDGNNLPTPEEKDIQFLKSTLGGCNDTEKSAGADEETADTVIVTLSNDTLNIFAGINYICCAPFITECNVANDSIFISVTDTCSNLYHSCYCRCSCYYTFDYYFDSIATKNYYWQIILNDPREDNPVLFSSGEIDIVETGD